MPSTTEALLDVNVLIASVFEDHGHHRRARQFVEALEHFYTCATTQGGFLRFATRPWKDEEKNEQPPRLSLPAAHAKLKKLTEASGHVFLPDDLSFIYVSLHSMSGHRQWSDAYLLKLANRHKVRLASIESRMSNLDDPHSRVIGCAVARKREATGQLLTALTRGRFVPAQFRRWKSFGRLRLRRDYQGDEIHYGISKDKV